MSVQLGISDMVVIIAMLVISAAIGVYFRFSGGRQKTTEEFLMAGRNMSVGPVAFSLMATNLTASSLLGIPAEAYLFGTQLFMMMVGMVIGGTIVAYGCVPVYYDMGVSTSYEYLEKRFGKITRSFLAFFFTIQTIILMAVVLYAPSLALNTITGLSTWTSILSMNLVCIFYCTMGGLKAILWTDVFQAILSYIAVIALIVQVSSLLGVSEIFSIAKEGGRLEFFNTSFDPTTRYTLWNTVFSGIFYSFFCFGTHQSAIQRMRCVGSIKKAQNAILWSLPLIFVFNVFTFTDGMVIYAMFHDCDPMKDPSVKLKSPDQIVPFTLLKLFGAIPGLTGLCISGVFSAALSTVSSANNALTTVILEDFIRPFCFTKFLKESRMTILSKVILLFIGGTTLLLTYVVANFRGVLEATYVLNGVLAGPVVGVFILGLFTKTAHEKGTLVGLIFGIILNSWIAFGTLTVKPKVQVLAQSIAGCPSNSTYFNGTTIFENTVTVSSLFAEEERYIFPMYKISYLLFPILGAIVVVFIGYTFSILLRLCMEVPEVNLKNLSPFVRKLLSASKKDTEVGMLENRKLKESLIMQ